MKYIKVYILQLDQNTKCSLRNATCKVQFDKLWYTKYTLINMINLIEVGKFRDIND